MALSGAVSVEIVYRADAAGEDVYWANRLEIEQDLNGLLSDPTNIANAFAGAFQSLLLPAFWLDRVVLSTYAQDGRPYNPETLFVYPYNQRGTRPGQNVGAALPLTNVLHIRKRVGSGRLGNLFLRGFLAEGDIQSDPNSGAVSLTEPQNIADSINQIYAQLSGALGSTAGLALISGQGLILQARRVTGFQVAGVSSRKFRTRRKSRLVQNAATQLRDLLDDGGITLDEFPQLVQAAGTVLRALGEAPIPPLLPPVTP